MIMLVDNAIKINSSTTAACRTDQLLEGIKNDLLRSGSMLRSCVASLLLNVVKYGVLVFSAGCKVIFLLNIIFGVFTNV